jgi:hypothetical protein
MVRPNSEGVEINEDRVKWIRRISKGRGLMDLPEDFPFDLFGVQDFNGLYDLLHRAQIQMPRWKSTAAIFNALGYLQALEKRHGFEERENPNLDSRRRVHAVVNDVSVRTVMRLEQSGAELLDEYVGRLIAPRTKEEMKYEVIVATNEMFDLLLRAGYPASVAILPSVVNHWLQLPKRMRSGFIDRVNELVNYTESAIPSDV